MGEVIDIMLVSKDENLFDKVLNYVLLYSKEESKQMTLEVMDNWEYENVKQIETYEMLKTYIGNKIVSVTKKDTEAQVGIIVEQKYDYLQYNLWMNFLYKISYKEIVNEFLTDLYEANIIDKIHIGAIGKEIMFNYDEEKKLTISNSHNVDVWIIEKKDIQYVDTRRYMIKAQKSYEEMDKEIYIMSSL